MFNILLSNFINLAYPFPEKIYIKVPNKSQKKNITKILQQRYICITNKMKLLTFFKKIIE